jgi:hypothetical protein
MNNTLKNIAGVTLGVIFSISLFAAGRGCKATPDVPPDLTPTRDIEHIKNDLKTDVATLQNTTTSIKENATQGKAKTPESARAVLDPFWINILVKAGVQETVVQSLQAKDAELQGARDQTEKLKEFAAKETARADKAEADATSEVRKSANKALMWALLATALGIGLMFSGLPIGKTVGGLIAVGGGVMAGLCLFVGQVAHLIPYFAIAVVALGLGMVVYTFIKHQKDKKVLTDEKKKLVGDKLMLQADKDALAEEKAKLVSENTTLLKDKAWLAKRSSELTLKMERLTQEKNEVAKKYQTALQENPSAVLEQKTTALETKVSRIESEFNTKTSAIEKKTAEIETVAKTAVKKVDALEKKTAEAVTKADSAQKAVEQNKYFLEGMAAGMGRREMWTARVA